MENFITESSQSLRKPLPIFEPPQDYFNQIYERIKRLPRIYSDVRSEHSMVVFEEAVLALNKMLNKQDITIVMLREEQSFVNMQISDHFQCFSLYFRRKFEKYDTFYLMIDNERPEVAIEELCANLKKMFYYNKNEYDYENPEEIITKYFGLATIGDYWYLASYDGAKEAEVCSMPEFVISECFKSNSME